MAKSESERRRERLAAALRENLKRRKAHKRGETASPPKSKPEPPKSKPNTHAETSAGDALSRPKPPR